MAAFRRTPNATAPLSSWTLHGIDKKVYVWLAGGDGARRPDPLFVDSTDKTVVEVLEMKMVDHAKQIQRITVFVRSKGACTLRGWIKGLGTDAALLPITVVDPIALPAENTDDGVLARLLLAETRGPGYANTWRADTAKRAMEWMRIVIANRQANPGPFRAASGSLLDVIKAKGQFHGFEGYPPPIASVTASIRQLIEAANNDGLPNQDSYITHVRHAISVAQALVLPVDPAGPEHQLVGWRTEGAGSPGGSMTHFQDMGGNSFYRMKK